MVRFAERETLVKLYSVDVSVNLPSVFCLSSHYKSLLHYAVLRNGRSGWFYRVIEEGEIKAGDQFLLLERKHPKWTVQRVQVRLRQRSHEVTPIRVTACYVYLQTTVYGNALPYGTMEPEVTGERRQELQELLQMEELTYRSWKDSIAKMLEGTFKWR